MIVRVVLIAVVAMLGLVRGVHAQEQAWLQIEAQPNLAGAEDRVRAYAALFSDVAGFQIASGWYAIVLGPYAPDAAAGRIFDLKRENMIPGDSFITDGSDHGQQFWPVGQLEDPVAGPVTAVDPVLPDPPADVPDETIREARASEAALTSDGRKQLQTALGWYGFYAAAVDGSFGPGTRNAMAEWQGVNGFEPTGVLTTMQRTALVANYQADQAEFGFETITEAEAGIEITLPMSLVQFDHYEPPFVHFSEKAGSGLRVYLISEPGDQSSLSGLYDVLQTLEVVPADGERVRGEDSFTINAQSDKVQSYAYAKTAKGMVKGFMVVWNPADADRMARILPAMKASFRPIGDKALDPGLVPMDDAARSGLLSGLEVKSPALSRSGFFVDAAGTVLTTVDAVANCGRVTIDLDVEATVKLTDAASGLAVLIPAQPLAPNAFAQFQTGAVRVGSDVAVAGYSYEAKLPAPVLSFGTFKEDKGLNGEADVARLAIALLPGDAGGPVVDQSGSVIGMALPAAVDGAKLLPDGVAFASSATAIAAVLAKAGVVTTSATRTGIATPDALNAAALGMTVLVSCWD